jgi:hypothetical protein
MTVFLANVHEAPALVALAHELGLDAVILMHLNGGDAYDWVETKPDDGWVLDYRANLPEADPKRVAGYIKEARRLATALEIKLTVDSRFDVYGISIVETPAIPVSEPAEALVDVETPVTPIAEPVDTLVADVPSVPEPERPARAEARVRKPSGPRMALRHLLRRSTFFKIVRPGATASTGAVAVEVPESAQSLPMDAPTIVEPEAAPPRYSGCREPWRWLNIAANGDVTPCCWAVRPLGNLNEVSSLEDIWNGQKMIELRDNIRENHVDAHICAGASCVYVSR